MRLPKFEKIQEHGIYQFLNTLSTIIAIGFFSALTMPVCISAYCFIFSKSINISWFDWTIPLLMKLVLLIVLSLLVVFAFLTVLVVVQLRIQHEIGLYCSLSTIIGTAFIAAASILFTTSSLYFIKSDEALAKEQKVQQVRDYYTYTEKK